MPYPYEPFEANRTNTTLSRDNHPTDHNSEQTALNDLRTLLGLNPKGVQTTVQARLENIESLFSLPSNGNARVAVSLNSGATLGTRRRINFIEGTNVTLAVTDDAANERINVTITSAVGTHASRHYTGAIDPLTGDLDSNARTGIRLNTGGTTYKRRRLNFVQGDNALVSIADSVSSEEVIITIGAVAAATPNFQKVWVQEAEPSAGVRDGDLWYFTGILE